MLKICARLLGLAQYGNRGSKGKKAQQGDASLSVNSRSQYLKNTYTAVRIVHAGGREELYKHEIPAAKLMEKYPGMCVAKPEVFKHPHQSVLLAEEKLSPGNKYYMIPCTTVKKLKRKHAGKNKVIKDECMSSVESSVSDGEIGYSSDDSLESVCSANDFYMSSERWRRCSRIKSWKGKKPFVPPIRNPNRACRKLGWEPSLDSVQEVSP